MVKFPGLFKNVFFILNTTYFFMIKKTFREDKFSKIAQMFYDLGCEYFTVVGEPDMRHKENISLFGKNGLDFKQIKENAVRDYLNN